MKSSAVIGGEAAGNVRVVVRAQRLDDSAEAASEVAVPFRLRVSLHEEGTGEKIPLARPEVEQDRVMASRSADGGPDTQIWWRDVSLVPAAGAGLRMDRLYTVRVDLSHREADGGEIVDGTLQSLSTPLLVLSGRLYFGEGARQIETRYLEVENDAAAEAIEAGGILSTRLKIPAGAGHITGLTEATFGDGSPLRVEVDANGDAFFRPSPTAAQVWLRGESSSFGNVAGLVLERTQPKLDAEGASAEEISVHLPAGAGFSTRSTDLVLRNHLNFGESPLDQGLAPLASEYRRTAAEEGAAAFSVHHERLPVRVACSEVVWLVREGKLRWAAGEATYVHAADLGRLEELVGAATAGLVVHGDDRRPGNDQYLREARSASAALVMSQRSDQGSGIDVSVSAAATDYRPHFPLGVELPVLGARLDLGSAEVVEAVSSVDLDPLRPGQLSYVRDCPTGDCPGGTSPGSISIRVPEGRLSVDSQGGLRGLGEVAGAPTSVSWGGSMSGQYTHRVGAFAAAALYVPGFVALREAGNLEPAQRAAALLLSGSGEPGNAARVERPGTESYLEGRANYAGLNFRVETGSHTGESLLAGKPTGAYPLRGNTKLYLRASGVNGVVQASAFPGELEIYGFPMRFRGFGLAFLSGENVDSRTAGELTVREPAGFRLPFERLRFRCLGELADATLPGETGLRRLHYWVTEFTPRTLEFRRPDSAPSCSASEEGFLVVGATIVLEQVVQPVHGLLAFDGASGDLATAADGSPIDSRLMLPGQFALRAADSGTYPLHGLSRAYFNRHRSAGRPERGFLTFFGRLDVPFFEDPRVQVLLVPGEGGAGTFLAGGWNALDSSPTPPGRAWLEAGRSPFESQSFDAANRGFPAELGLTAESYRDHEGARFHPRAQKLWQGMTSFDFALKWEPLTRRFTSFEEPPSAFLVFEVGRQLRQMTGKRADVQFAAEFKGLPRFHPEQLLLEEVEGRTGVFGSVSNALQSAMGEAAQTVRLSRAIERLDDLVRDRLNEMLDAPLRQAFAPVVELLYEHLVQAEDAGQGVASKLKAEFCGRLSDAFLRDAMVALLEGTNEVGGLARGVDRALTEARDGVSSLQSILAKRSAGPGRAPSRFVVQEISKRLLREQLDPPVLGEVIANSAGQLLDELLAEYVTQLEPVYAEIEAQLSEVDRQLATAQRGLREGGDSLFGQLDQAVTEAGALLELGKKARAELCARVGELAEVTGGVVGDREPAQIKRELQRILEEQFYGSLIPREVGFVLRSRFAGARGIFRQSLDQWFANLNDQVLGAVRELGERGIGGAAGLGPSEEFVSALGALNDSVGAARLHGHARINGDSLHEARLDGHFQLNVPDPKNPLHFDAFVLYESADALPVVTACPGTSIAGGVITFGATASSSAGLAGNQAATPLKVGMEARLSLSDRGIPTGADGKLSFGGQQKVGGYELKDAQFLMGFGPGKSYLGARLAGSFEGIAAEVSGFFGRTCALSPLEAVDPDVVRVLSLPEVGFVDGAGTLTGAPVGYYLSAGGWFPLEKLLGVPTTCLLSLRARAVHGWFGFVRGNFSNPESLRFVYGQRELWAVEGEVLCGIGVSGELKLIGAVAASPADPRTAAGAILGDLKVGAKLGICPVCETFEKRFGIEGTASRSGIRFGVEY
ncbi:MAG: hypothetical protein IT580_06830 [Verrucomicrobiales bacterium]|nr:hypothetical protein [Verrucomicrobiales bacterium]